MKKILLLVFAVFTATSSLTAQSQFRALRQTRLSETKVAPQGKLLLQKETSAAVTRAGRAVNEDGSVDPKILQNISGADGSVYLIKSETSGTTEISFATFYDPALVQRFSGNKITKLNTYIGPNASKVTAWIANANTGIYLWEKGNPLFSTKNSPKAFSIACDYTIDPNVPIIVGFTATYSGSEVAFPVASNYMGSALLIDFNDGEGLGDYSSYGTAYIECVTEGAAGLSENDVMMSASTSGRFVAGTDYASAVSFINLGAKPVSVVKVKTELNGKVVEDVIQSEDPVPYLGSVQFMVKDLAPAQSGRYYLGVQATEVNGQADGFPADNKTTGLVVSIGKPAKRKAVMEEFTGTWCGWCPRGLVAMEKMKEMFPHDFIAVSVHAGDEMDDLTYQQISYTAGFPSALLNRLGLIDPYYGTGEDATSDVSDDIRSLLTIPCEALIGISSDLNDDKSSVNVTATMKFTMPAEGRNYRLAYVLTEDGITGYDQINYYHPAYGQVSEDKLPDDLKFLVNTGTVTGSDVVYQPIFNDVSRGIYDLNGIAGSLDGITFTEGKYEIHNYSLAIPSSVKNVENLKVAVLLLDMETGEVVTAEQAKVGESNFATGLGQAPVQVSAPAISVSAGAISVEGASVAQVQVYAADGKLVTSVSANGSVSIPTMNFANGTYIVRVVSQTGVTVKKVSI